MSSRSSRRRRGRVVSVIIVILFIVLLALSVLLLSRFHVIDLGSVFRRTEKTPEPSLTTEAPVVYENTPVPATPEPTATPYPEPSMQSSDYRFSVEGTPYSGSVSTLSGSDQPAFVKLTELAAFLNTKMSIDNSGNVYSFRFDGNQVSFTGNKDEFTVGDTVCALSTPAVPFNSGRDIYVPAEDVLSVLYPTRSGSGKGGTVNFSSFIADFEVQKGRQIPIFSYYTVNNGTGPDYRMIHHDSVMPENFEEQLKYLTENGYTAITFEDLAHLEEIEKPVMITFDGCYADVYSQAWPLIKQYKVKVTMYVWPDYIGQAGRISEVQLKDMVSSGLVSVQAAIETYETLDYLSVEELTGLLEKSKAYVTAISGHEPLSFAYPAGAVNTRAREVCSSMFRFCVRRSAERAYDTERDDGSLIFRYTIQRETPIQTYSYWASKAK